MKAAPVLHALAAYPDFHQRLVHTGQHYDVTLSDRFFQQLALPEPDVNLGVGSASHAVQTAEVMMRLEPELIAHRPGVLVVYGDVNSTMAAALVAAKLLIPVAHVEAGLRSFDWTMPEEINRLVTDRLASLLLTPSDDADENLVREGIDPAKVSRIGNVMIDSLVRSLPAATPTAALDRVGLSSGTPFVLLTLHRPSSVDDPDLLRRLMGAISEIARDIAVIFPVHPRTRARLGGESVGDGVLLTEPLGYFEFIGLEQAAALVITDSGGVQEETTYLGVPCLTVRDNTERPVTITQGTNKLVGRDPEVLVAAVREALSMPTGSRRIPELWEGRAGERAAQVITRFLRGTHSD